MNYKIKVGSEAESKEVQDLFFELGYVWHDTKCKTQMRYVEPVYYSSFDDMELACDVSDVNYKHKEITLPQLRDLVVLKRNSIDDATHELGKIKYYNGTDQLYFFGERHNGWLRSVKNINKLKPITKEECMKEYLNPNQDYKLVTCKVGYTPIPSNWIEIPEGALFAYETGSTGLLFTRNKRDAYNGFLVWQRETLNDKVASTETARQADKVLKEILEGGQDNVNQPSHYNKGGIECINAIQSSMTHESFCGYLKGNVQKYMWRYENKGGVESLKKAQWYLNKLIEIQNDNS